MRSLILNMARHKDFDWNLPDGTLQADGCRTYNYDIIQIALLMDLRDELKKLNVLLHCPNFIAIPWKLDQIRLNTAKHRPARKKKKSQDAT